MVPKKFQCLQRALFVTRLSQNLGGIEIGDDRLRIGIGVDTVIDNRKKFFGRRPPASFIAQEILAAVKSPVRGIGKLAVDDSR